MHISKALLREKWEAEKKKVRVNVSYEASNNEKKEYHNKGNKSLTYKLFY